MNKRKHDLNTDAIRNARKKRQLTQAKLSELLNVEEKTVGKWERGERFPRPENLKNLFEILALNESCSISIRKGCIGSIGPVALVILAIMEIVLWIQ
jgi:transcriptional regulator with XRE-family HTH domain